MTTLKSPVLLAEIGAPHGVRGEVRVKSYTGDPEAIGDYGPLMDYKGRSYTVENLRALKDDMLVVAFIEIPDRTAAEKLTRTKLYVDRSALPEPDDEEEFYHADLIGMPVETTAGEALGAVLAVPNFGADDLLEIERPGRKSIYVPFTRTAVPTIDLAARRIVVDPPPGLLEEASPDEEAEGRAAADGETP